MNELRLNAEIKSYEWFSFTHISWPTFSNLMSVPKAASAGFYTEQCTYTVCEFSRVQVNDVRLRDGTEWGGALFSLEWLEILSYFFWLHSPPPRCPSFLYNSRITFSAVATIHLNHILLYLTLQQQHTLKHALVFLCWRADGAAAAAAAAAFASSAEANNSLTVLSLSSTERGREGWKWKGRRGESETRREGEIKSREMDETGKGSEGGVGWREKKRWWMPVRGADEKIWRGRRARGKERKGDGSAERRESHERGKPQVKYKCSGEESGVVVDASSFITAALAAKNSARSPSITGHRRLKGPSAHPARRLQLPQSI